MTENGKQTGYKVCAGAGVAAQGVDVDLVDAGAAVISGDGEGAVRVAKDVGSDRVRCPVAAD